MEKNPSFPLQTVLELACAAQRLNKEYIKVTEPIYSDDNKLMSYKWDNKILILTTLDPNRFKPSEDSLKPPLLCTNRDDAELADEIRKYYKRLLFSAIQGDNEFQTEVNALLSSETVATNKLGFIACLPSVYKRDYGRHQLEKKIKTADVGWLGEVGDLLLDKDCEVLKCQRSKNFDAFNIDAIIDNKIVSWMSKYELKLGPTVVVKAKVKDQGFHWSHKETPVTRLNFVKAAQ
jgi:hypothetical protein